jgi:hypothetical protein
MKNLLLVILLSSLSLVAGAQTSVQRYLLGKIKFAETPSLLTMTLPSSHTIKVDTLPGGAQ